MTAGKDSTRGDRKASNPRYDPLLNPSSSGLSNTITNMYDNFHPAAKTILKFLVLLAVPIRVYLTPYSGSIDFVFGQILYGGYGIRPTSFVHISLNTDVAFYTWILTISAPSIWLVYLRQKKTGIQISHKSAGFAIVITYIISLLATFRNPLLEPTPILEAILPSSGKLALRLFPLITIVFLIVFPQIFQWIENLRSKGKSPQNIEDNPRVLKRLTAMVTILLLFAPFLGSVSIEFYFSYVHIVLGSLFCSFSVTLFGGMLFSFVPIAPSVMFLSFTGALLFGFPRILFALRLLRYFAGTETRKRVMRMGILCLAWPLLIIAIAIVSSPVPEAASVSFPLPVPLLVIFGIIAMYRPQMLGFLFTERASKGISTEARLPSKKDTKKEPENVTVPLLYLIKSKLSTSRWNIWRDKTETEISTA